MKKIKYLGLIPARKGSKGLLNKNLKLLKGKPLIQYTLESAKSSNRLDSIHVTTDSEEIMALANQYGIESPYTRPAELASDTASMVDTVLYHLSWFLENRDTEIQNIVLLQPTNPIRSKLLIDQCIATYEENNRDSLVAVTECLQHPYETFIIGKDGGMKFLISELPARRQDYPRCYFISGAVYITSSTFLRQKKKLFDSTSHIWLTSREEGIDIDDIFTFKIAECLLEPSEINLRETHENP